MTLDIGYSTLRRLWSRYFTCWSHLL